MTINISTVRNTLSPPYGPGRALTADIPSSMMEAYQAEYAFTRTALYSDFRDTFLTGYHYGNAPWYTPPRSTDSNWIGHLVRLWYEVPTKGTNASPIVLTLPNSDLDTVAVTPPTNSVPSVGVPALKLLVEGVNLEYYFQIQAVKLGLGPPSNDGFGIDYNGGRSIRYGNLIGSLNILSPWLSTFATFDNRVGLPAHAPGETDRRFYTLDFYYRGSNDDEDQPGYLTKLAIIEPQFSDFPAGSY